MSASLAFMANSDWADLREIISDYLAKNNISFTTFVAAKSFEIKSIPLDHRLRLRFDILIDEEGIGAGRICKITFSKNPDVYPENDQVMMKIYSDLKTLLKGYSWMEKQVDQQFCYV